MPIRKEETAIAVDKNAKWLKIVVSESQRYDSVVVTGKGGLNVNFSGGRSLRQVVNSHPWGQLIHIIMG